MRWLEQYWYRITPLHAVLLPLSLLFQALAWLRRLIYRSGLLPTTRLPVPVIVVGNVSVGGSGKTPLVLWLALALRERGMRPGIISRGYGGAAAMPQSVTAASDPAQAGDEPVLLAQKSGCPVQVGADRAATAQALLNAHPECNVLLSDDGLQHYRLARDVEIAVVDGERGFGNGLFLPAGPLREGISRLASVDAVVINKTQDPSTSLTAGSGPFDFAQGGPGDLEIEKLPNSFTMRLTGIEFYNLLNPDFRTGPANFQGRQVHAVTGIGNPQRFFDHLTSLGLGGVSHAFPDHYRFAPQDLHFDGAEAILMTEKDAVKCVAFANEKCWALPVEAQLDPRLAEKILDKIRNKDGPQAA